MNNAKYWRDKAIKDLTAWHKEQRAIEKELKAIAEEAAKEAAKGVGESIVWSKK
jgi:hypothetical protein